MSLCRSVGLGALLARRGGQYAFVATGRLRSGKGDGVFDDKERAAENVYVRKHEEEEAQRRKEAAERKAKEDAKKQAEKK